MPTKHQLVLNPMKSKPTPIPDAEQAEMLQSTVTAESTPPQDAGAEMPEDIKAYLQPTPPPEGFETWDAWARARHGV